jgi:hypothetical protein
VTQLLEDFLASGVEPFPDDPYGPGYRCSVELSDGTELPCVMLRRQKSIVDLAVRRFAEEKSGKGIFRSSTEPYRDIVARFVTGGNRVNTYDIKGVRPSRFAIPLSLLQQIESETVMAWTGFVLEMRDGPRFAFGTPFRFAFFDLPNGYDFDDVRDVINHSYLDDNGEICSIRADTEKWRSSISASKVYRDKPFFDCFV